MIPVVLNFNQLERKGEMMFLIQIDDEATRDAVISNLNYFVLLDNKKREERDRGYKKTKEALKEIQEKFLVSDRKD